MFDDDETVREILADFVKPTRAIVAEIMNGYSNGSAEAVKQAAHKLKSAARSIGAHALADLCLELEAAGKADDLERIGRNIPAMEQSMAETESYINKLINE
jgi:HPt (histidine-containing phosphotransfer) domain-containing protein